MLDTYKDGPDLTLGDIDVTRASETVTTTKEVLVKRFVWDVDLEDLSTELKAHMVNRLAVALRTEELTIPAGARFEVQPRMEGGECFALRFIVVLPEER